jgi:hypothetical protein
MLMGVASEAGCLYGPDRECEHGEDHCEGSVAYYCTEYDTSSGNGTRWQTTQCASADRCKTDESGAYCTVEPDHNPLCPPELTGGILRICDGADGVHCRSGFVTDWFHCASCTGFAECEGDIKGACPDLAHPCASGLTCIDNLCVGLCSCPPGIECSECDSFGKYARLKWICDQGVCKVHPR